MSLTLFDWSIAIICLLIIYPYFIYPCILALFNLCAKRIMPRVNSSDNIQAVSMSVITPCFNTADCIEEKIKNLLALKAPQGKVEFIMVSDHSSDETDNIIKQYEKIKLIRTPERYGKERALNYALKQAEGEVIVLTDCTTFMREDGLNVIEKAFQSSDVGVVSSYDDLPTTNKTPEYFYVNLEMWIREQESKYGYLVSASGSLFAARQSLCLENPHNLPSDFHVTLTALNKGFKCVQDNQLKARYQSSPKTNKEFERRVRTYIHGFRTLSNYKNLLNIKTHPLMSWMLFSHKIIKWLTATFLLLIFAISGLGMLYGSGLCIIVFSMFSVLSLITIIGSKPTLARFLPLSTKVSMLVQGLLASIVAFRRFKRGQYMDVWQPTTR